ncbi:unnamed protein product, partial [Prorocentrum cordatum]
AASREWRRAAHDGKRGPLGALLAAGGRRCGSAAGRLETATLSFPPVGHRATRGGARRGLGGRRRSSTCRGTVDPRGIAVWAAAARSSRKSDASSDVALSFLSRIRSS